MKVAIIIPFYQRTRGLLAAAVASVAAQRVDAGVRIDIIVIDDGSPVSAASETMPVMPACFHLWVLTQRNGGVAAARNAGLEAVTADTDYVAFLDSDDCWAPDHLQTGLTALSRGADFYFDNTDNGDDGGKDRLGSSTRLRQRHGPLDPAHPLSALIDGRQAFDDILAEHIPHTSQVIYDFQRHGAVRFDESLKLAGEDLLFWLSLATYSDKTSYHTGVMGHRGRGVSIYRSTLAWGSRDGINRVLDEIRMRNKIEKMFNLSFEQAAAVNRDLQWYCDHFFFLAVRNAYRHPLTVFSALIELSTVYRPALRHLPQSILRLRSHRARLLSAVEPDAGPGPATQPGLAGANGARS